MKLIIRHQTIYHYGEDSSRAAMLLKLMPTDSDAQTVLEWTISINDQPLTSFLRNGHGDLEALWVRHDQLERVEIVASGVVETRDRAGVVTGMAAQPDPRIYLRNTPLTCASPEMKDVANGVTAQTTLERLHLISAQIRELVAYRTGATDSATAAHRAFAQGAGVCQDHAQIFIAMARHIGVPARYVSGYLLASSEVGTLHETHAWAEAWVEALGWIGFDISNGVCATDHYVRVASGLDAHDAAPLRGLAVGSAPITVDADVRIDPLAIDDRPGAISELRQQQQ